MRCWKNSCQKMEKKVIIEKLLFLETTILRELAPFLKNALEDRVFDKNVCPSLGRLKMSCFIST